ncbi:TRAP transporter substrate-binding protein DctP [Acuticoccus mangrovi]|uniref:TRAP transporter substrate-binding protein DctP n=1 Tax=Acuticoccus mangrovi TaxID=2796142 RepID=A0A934IK94_9HYPH|nr:TRAP transporter substrate-binding protein DctP [Acuticoccus mangrovi]MBJ3778038.1 TRAP transporter substrate-binding protein DctP [Acuticoccus mangrovi]
MNSLRAAVAVAALALSVGASEAKTYRWITFKPQGAGDAQQRSTQWFVDEFAKRTGGKHTIEVFWGGSVAGTREIPTALASGVGDFGDIITPYFPDQFPLNNAVGFFIPQPNNTREIGELMEKWHAEIPQFEQELANSGIKAVGFRPLESYGILCTEPVESVADFKGRRIRSYGFAYPKLIEALGGSPVSIATSETYEALERGIVDCTPIGPALARGWKYDEVAKYYIEYPIGASFGHLLAMNLASYEGMDEETRAIVDQLGKDYLGVYADMLDDDESTVREAWESELGVTVIDPGVSTEDMATLSANEGIQEVRKDWIERATALGVDPDPIVAELEFK